MQETGEGRSQRRAAKRAEILAAATEIFFEEGYARASMDRIIDKIGGSKRTIYSYFPSKEALFAAIVKDVSARILVALTPTKETDDVRGNLTDMATRYLDIILSHEALALFRVLVSEAANFPDLARTFSERGQLRRRRNMAKYFEAVAARGLVRVRDPKLAAEQFLGMVGGFIQARAALCHDWSPPSEDLQARVDQAVGIFLAGVAAKEAADTDAGSA